MPNFKLQIMCMESRPERYVRKKSIVIYYLHQTVRTGDIDTPNWATLASNELPKLLTQLRLLKNENQTAHTAL